MADARENLIAIENVTHAYQTDGHPLPVLEDLTLGVWSMVLRRWWVLPVAGSPPQQDSSQVSCGLTRARFGYTESKVVSPRSTVGMAFQNPVL